MNEEEYALCCKAASNYWANNKKGNYGKGLANTLDDPHKVTRTGLLGQLAFAKAAELPMDFAYREGGDQQDNLFLGKKIDVKCTIGKKNNILIYKTNEWGREIPLNKDIYIGSYVLEDNGETAQVVLTGFILREDILKCEVEQGKGTHFNYVIPVSKLKPISRFLEVKKKFTPSD